MYWAHDQLNVESSKSTLFEDLEKVEIRLANWIYFLLSHLGHKNAVKPKHTAQDIIRGLH